MDVSEKRVAANRLNSLKSTGPNTKEGKGRSRENALTHGLTATVVIPEDAATFQAELDSCFDALRPQNQFQVGLVEDIALINLRSRRAQRIEAVLRDQIALDAMTSWDDDRRLEVERVAGRLSERPEEVVAELRRSPHGCDWLLGRWARLAGAAKAGGGWTADQKRLAFDLLGTPPEFRSGNPGDTLDADNNVVPRAPEEVAGEQIELYQQIRESVARRDEVARVLAEADLSDDSAEIRRVRRNEAALHRRLRWCHLRLADPIPDGRPLLHLKPEYHKTQTEAEERAEIAAEERAKAEKDDREEIEYYAKLEARERREALEASKKQARRDARARTKENARLRKQAAAEAEREADKRQHELDTQRVLNMIDRRARSAAYRREEKARLAAQDEAIVEAQDEAIVEAQNEAIVGVQNEAIVKAQNEAIIEARDEAIPRRPDPEALKSQARREGKTRKRELQTS